MTHEHGSHNDGRTHSTAKWVFIGFILIAGYFLMMEHRAHLAGVLVLLPFLLLLACLLHFFHHGRHGDGHRSTAASNESTQENK